MGLCTDRSISFLKGLGLNVVLQPRDGIVPLALVGEFKGSRALIGTLDQLVEPGAGPLPTVTSHAAANINGQRSSKLPIEIGLNVLGNVIGAMGGNLGISAAYSNARKVEFQYSNVTRHRANVIAIGDYLAASSIRWDHPVLKKFLFGKGNLYVLTEVVTSPLLKVTAFSKNDASLKLDIPVISQIVGGSVKVGRESEQSHTVSYEGPTDLAFGFVAIELSAGDRDNDGEFDLVFRPVAPGGVAVSFGAPVMAAALFDPLDALEDADPAALGEAA